MLIRELVVTQNRLRNTDQIAAMVEFVRQGGRFTSDAMLASAIQSGSRASGPIAISQIGRTRFVHDGHHRLVAIFLGGRDYVCHEEFTTTKRAWADYWVANPPSGWLTPFDPGDECRLPEFGAVKLSALAAYNDGVLDEFLAANRHRYVEPREIETIAQLAEAVR